MTKPVALIDMDGPLADFDTAIWAACDSAGIPLSCTRETQTVRFLSDAASKADKARMQTIVEAKEFFLNLPPVDGCKEGMEALAEEFEVWICTKPLETNPYCRDEKAAWVHRHLGWEWVDRLILAGDKSLVQGAFLLDDAPKPKWFKRALWQPVIFPTVWNGAGSQWEGLPRWTWGDPIDNLFAFAAGGHPHGGVDFEDVELPMKFA